MVTSLRARLYAGRTGHVTIVKAVLLAILRITEQLLRISTMHTAATRHRVCASHGGTISTLNAGLYAILSIAPKLVAVATIAALYAGLRGTTSQGVACSRIAILVAAIIRLVALERAWWLVAGILITSFVIWHHVTDGFVGS